MRSAASELTHHSTVKVSARVADLFERYGRMVFGICRTMLRDVHDAEDATQQTFLSAHRALLRGAAVRDPGAWIATIARNECRGRIAAGMRDRLPVPADDLAELVVDRDDVDQGLRTSELLAALRELPERQREAVVLRYVHGLRYAEVAKALGVSRPATEALLFRARRTLRGRLRPVAGAAVVVPGGVRDALASALPGFDTDAGTGTGVVAGLVAKLAAAPTLAKLGTATVAATAVGAVGVMHTEGTRNGVLGRAPVEGAVAPLPSTWGTARRTPHRDATRRLPIASPALGADVAPHGRAVETVWAKPGTDLPSGGGLADAAGRTADGGPQALATSPGPVPDVTGAGTAAQETSTPAEAGKERETAAVDSGVGLEGGLSGSSLLDGSAESSSMTRDEVSSSLEASDSGSSDSGSGAAGSSGSDSDHSSPTSVSSDGSGPDGSGGSGSDGSSGGVGS